MKKLSSLAAVALLVVAGCEYQSSGGHSEHLVTLTDENFRDQVIRSETPVLVDFWATWCGPCQKMTPTINELADEFAGQVVIGKLDIDENKATAQQYSVSSIPALLVFKNGREVKRFVGVTGKEELAASLSSLLE